MRRFIIGASLLALMAPAAHAQQAPKPASPPSAMPAKPMAAPTPAPAMQQEMKKFLVFFDWNKATLTPEARRIIATAAEDFKKTGSTRIVATGHTDTSGSAAYNMRLSVRRAEAVKAELVRLGVPAGVITTIGRGQEDLLVPTKDNVREPQNRRVSIEFPVPLPPKPAPA
ncbi:MAG: OmpA family protein, partial [Rhodospirillales bacterium]|nr:OmpA family protein [Rhodospirillales bacterium]